MTKTLAARAALLMTAVLASAGVYAQEAPKVAPGPKMVVEQDVVDAGQIVRGSSATATFVIRNEGTEPLKILNAKPG